MEGLEGHTLTCDNFFYFFFPGRRAPPARHRHGGNDSAKQTGAAGGEAAGSPQLAVRLQPDAYCGLLRPKERHVLLMSTKHRQHEISEAEHRKPVRKLDYNKNKGAVDNLDKIRFFNEMLTVA